MTRIDLHAHSRISDGTDSPTELVQAAAAAGLGVVALTDHDTLDGIAEAQQAADRWGVRLQAGVELSCQRRGASVHLLGYGVDAAHPELADEMARVRRGRTDRLGPVLQRLAELGVPVSREQVMAQVGDSPSVGRPHIADAMVRAGHVADRREAFDRFLADGGPAHVARYAIELGRGIDLVHAAGGVAVVAHPWGRGSRDVLPPEVLAALVGEHGLDGIEVDHHDHDPGVRTELRTLTVELGVLATGSSDYHGTGKVDHDLGSNTTDPAAYEALVARLADRRHG